MSFFSSLIGGILGVALAILLPGPLTWGVGMVAFTIGAGIGSYIDPVMPDTDSAGAPQIGTLDIVSAEEGTLIFEVLGTSMVKGNIFDYWGDRSEEVTQEVDVGKGGSSTQTVTEGWKYYLSWCQGFCLGPVDTLYAMYAGDDLVWEGELDAPAGGMEVLSLSNLDVSYQAKDAIRNVYATLYEYTDASNIIVEGNPFDFVDADPDNIDLGIYPEVPQTTFEVQIIEQRDSGDFLIYGGNSVLASYDYNSTLDRTTLTSVSASIPNPDGTQVKIRARYRQNFAVAGTDTPMGTCRFYFGTTDQEPDNLANTGSSNAYDSKLTDPTLISAYRGLCYAVFDDAYIGSNNRAPTMSIAVRRSPTYAFNASNVLSTYDYNPAHAIYHIIEGDDRMLGLTGYCNSATFSAVATTLSNEDRGISLRMDRLQTSKNWIETILKHVRGMLRSSSDE